MKHWSIVILWLYSSILPAQDCNISVRGQILDKATSEPLESALVGIEELALGGLSDSSGYFHIEGVCPGKYHLIADHLGCPPETFFLSVTGDTFLIIYLDHHSELLREIVVERAGDPGRNSSVRNSIRISDPEQSGKSISDLASRISGVNSIRNGPSISKPVIHGLSGNRIAVINNGLNQAGQQWGIDHAPEIDPASAEVITIVKGSDAVEYGSMALGGALLSEPGPLTQDPHVHGRIGYGLSTNGWSHFLHSKLTDSFGKFSCRLTGSLKIAGDQKAPEYFLTNTGTHDKGFSFQLRHTQGVAMHDLYYSLYMMSPGVFAGAHISNLTDLENAIGRAIPFNIRDRFSYHIDAPRQDVGHHLLKYKGESALSGTTTMAWTYGVQWNRRQEYDVRRSNLSDKPSLDLSFWSHIADVKLIRAGGRLPFKAGLQGKFLDNTNQAGTGILPLLPDYREGNIAAYFKSMYNVGKWVLDAGWRADVQLIHVWSMDNSPNPVIAEYDHRFWDAAFFLGASGKEDTPVGTRANIAMVIRSPEVNELYSQGLHQGVAGIEEGNRNLKSEASLKGVISETIFFKKFLHVEASVFFHLIADYIYLSLEDELRLTIRGAFPVYTYQQDDVWLRGLDLDLVADISDRVEWAVSFSWLKGNHLRTNIPLNAMPPASAESSISWSVKDSKFWKKPYIKISGSYTARQKNWDSSSDLLAPPGDYFLANLQAGVSIMVQGHPLEINVSLENALNVQYRDYLNRLRYFADEPGRNGRLNLQYHF